MSSSRFATQALNQYNGDQVIDGSGGGSATAPPFGQITPPGEANNIGYDYRFYDVKIPKTF